jgi:CubicO group peptidase (beta-lactamase class C family)
VASAHTRPPALLALLLVALLQGCGKSPAVPEDPGRAGDGTLSEALGVVRAAHDLPALAGVMVHEGRVVEMAAVGVRAEGAPEPVTDGDLWHIGSLTKAMTATVAARLVERGAVTWSTTVSQALPGLAQDMRPEYAGVTLTELLSHTSGLPDEVHEVPIWPTLGPGVGPDTPDERRRWTAQLLGLEPERSRGEYLYSNAGYVVAGAMLEALTGMAWESLIEQELFQPLGITTGGFGAPGEPGTHDQPWGHLRSGGGWTPLSPGPGADNPAALGPAGTVHISMADMALYMTEHLAGAEGRGGILEAESFRRLHTPAPGSSYALGWWLDEQPWTGGAALNHDGSNLRWFARLWLAPGRDLGLFTVTNAGGGPGSDGTDDAALVLIERFEAAYGR